MRTTDHLLHLFRIVCALARKNGFGRVEHVRRRLHRSQLILNSVEFPYQRRLWSVSLRIDHHSVIKEEYSGVNYYRSIRQLTSAIVRLSAAILTVFGPRFPGFLADDIRRIGRVQRVAPKHFRFPQPHSNELANAARTYRCFSNSWVIMVSINEDTCCCEIQVE